MDTSPRRRRRRGALPAAAADDTSVARDIFDAHDPRKPATRRRGRLARAGAAVLLAGTAVAGVAAVPGTALADTGPKLPAGCSFDQATGVETCITTATTTATLGPITYDGSGDNYTQQIDGYRGRDICELAGQYDSANGGVWQMTDVSLVQTVTTTTTTERHGLNGSVFSTTDSTSKALTGVILNPPDGSITCAPLPPPTL